jgi:hypothetical protein
MLRSCPRCGRPTPPADTAPNTHPGPSPTPRRPHQQRPRQHRARPQHQALASGLPDCTHPPPLLLHVRRARTARRPRLKADRAPRRWW